MRTASAFVLLALAAPLARAQQPSFQGLGIPAGRVTSRWPAVSADGSTIVVHTDGGADSRAYRWTAATGYEALPLRPGDAASSPGGVSADGSFVAGYAAPSGGQEPVRWTPAGVEGLGSLPGSNLGIANDISSAGSVVVGFAGYPAQAFRWTLGTGMVALGAGPSSVAYAVSADGSVVVGYGSPPGGGSEAFLWTQAGLSWLGTLPGQSASRAFGVSADGSVVVGYATGSNAEAFRWRPSTGMQPLPPIVPGAQCRANDVSADGSVIVGFCYAPGPGGAVVWTEAEGVRSVRAILEAAGIDLTGWYLEEAFGVSDDGTVIVGHGTSPAGEPEAWRAVIGGAPAGLVVNVVDDDPDGDAADGRCDADEGESGDQCTLRAAIEEAVRRGGGTITFDVPGGGIPRIDVGPTALPALTAPITIDGATQPGGAFVELAGPGAVADAPDIPGIEIGLGGGGSAVRGLVVHGFKGGGVLLEAGANGCTIEGNRIGTDAAGTAWQGNGRWPGSFPHWEIESNYRGGVNVRSDFNLIVGNVIAGNFFSFNNFIRGGVEVFLMTGAEGNRLEGNRIGIGADGQVVPWPLNLGRIGTYGVLLFNASGTTIGAIPGGAEPPAACTGPCNVIAGHDLEVFAGLQFFFSEGDGSVEPRPGGGSGNVVAGNFIGTNLGGAPTEISGYGVAVSLIDEAALTVSHNRVVGPGGGVFFLAGRDGRVLNNVVSGRDERSGRLVTLEGEGHRVEGNVIRLSGFDGVHVRGGSGHFIARNVIHGHAQAGVAVEPVPKVPRAEITQNVIYDNGIGIDLVNHEVPPYYGVTPNDAGDGDQGPNDLLNFPVVAAVTREDAGVRVRGHFQVPLGGGATHRVELFANPDCRWRGARSERGAIGVQLYGQGAHYLGSDEVAASAGFADFDYTALSLPAGMGAVALTLTNTEARITSEFSRCVRIGEADLYASAEIGSDQTGLALDEQGGAVTITEPAGGAALQGGDGGTLFVTRYEARPDTSAYADASATAPSGAEVEPEAVAARHWYLADVGLTPDGGNPASALRYDLCLDPEGVVLPERLGDVVLVQRNDSTAGLWVPFDTQATPRGLGSYLCAAGLSLFGEFSIGGPPSAFPDGGGPGGLPDEFALGFPYPNPAFGAMTVLYDVAEAGDVRLSVYDLLGREVARLVDGEADVGRYEATLDTQNLASGVYVVQLTAGRFGDTRKVTLLR
ncbi:MAG TPA: right-handed parallel beta-helix repeat-containing protein [Rubricoccaceae bacterium]|nr:right-handed parallel beta-helix repeat-containing protein [Rubricoccaceae bacterium]